jgi:hypothetical protein
MNETNGTEIADCVASLLLGTSTIFAVYRMSKKLCLWLWKEWIRLISSPLIVPQHFTKKLMVNPSGSGAFVLLHVPKSSLDLLLSEVCVESGQVDGRPLEGVPVEIEVTSGRQP